MSTALSSAPPSPSPREANRPRKSRTVAQRRVYGKRRADAPRAVFDQRSPVKQEENTEEENSPDSQNGVDAIQTKLAEIHIDETPTAQRKKNIVGEPENTELQCTESEVVEPEHCEPKDVEPEAVETIIPEDVTTTDVEIEETIIEEKSVASHSPMSTPILRKKYETMVAVRITPRFPMRKTLKLAKDTDDPSDSVKPVRKHKPAPRLSSGCVLDEKANDYVRAILNEALSPIAAQSVQKFGSWAARGGNLLEVVKIAEGSYGEVYKLRLREEACKQEMSRSKLARLKAYGDGVFKIVPLRAQRGLGSKKFTTIDEIVSEVKMLKYLDPIPGFARFREIHVVQGRFPESFQNAWDYYKKTKDDCLNPNPSNKRAYPDTQLWAIVEMDDAGCELEKFSWSSTFQIYDIFWGVAMALARSEEYAKFEHRDLHLGNVCIRSTRSDGCMDPPTDLDIMSRPCSSGFGLSTLETTIIDYSLSRAELQISEELPGSVEVASSDLDKKQIFDAIGRDEDEILLRNTYRYMRGTLYNGNPADTEKTPDIPGIWAEYAPRTNLVWLLFLLKSLLKNRKPEPSALTARQPLAPRTNNKELKKTPKPEKNAANHSKPLVPAGQDQVIKLRNTLEERLQKVLNLLDLENGHEDMCCAADLVAFAIDSQWLDEQDFF